MIGVLVIRVPLCSDPVDISQSHTVCFLKKTVRSEFQFLTFYKEIEIPDF